MYLQRTQKDIKITRRVKIIFVDQHYQNDNGCTISIKAHTNNILYLGT